MLVQLRFPTTLITIRARNIRHSPSAASLIHLITSECSRGSRDRLQLRWRIERSATGLLESMITLSGGQRWC